MHFAATQMHMLTFCIIAFELAMLLVQVIYFLERPGDKRRLWYLILLVFLLLYNICGGLFPDEKIPIPIVLQTIIAYLVGFMMSMYVVYYFYKVFELNHLKFFVTYGILLFLFVPFIFLFVVPYILTGNLELSRKLTVIIPFFYGLSFIYSTTRALIFKYKAFKKQGSVIEDTLYKHAIAAYVAMLCWAALPVIVFFGDFQILEHSVTNAGFLMMTIMYVRSSIKLARKEHNKLLSSEKSLQQINIDLKELVKVRTENLEKLYEQRANTFINLAHDTKTPLTLINNYLDEYIKKNGEDEELKIMKVNMERLSTDVVNFFDIEKYNKGFDVYHHDQISNISFILSSKISLFKALANKKSIRIKENIDPEIFVKAHPAALDRITNNLIENALKYTGDNGEIFISLFANTDLAIFKVSDNGIGISKHLQNNIFEPYFQIGSVKKSNDGMGLGLTIVKRIVEDIGGNIMLESKEGQGTTVEIKVKRHIPSEWESANEDKIFENVNIHISSTEVEDAISDPDKPYILIVEDNLSMLNYLIKKLKPRYNVYTAKNGESALQKMTSITQLDLIISDVMMDTMNGLEFSKTISSNDRYGHIPLIFLTSKSTSADKLEGLKTGAIDYIEKPFLIDELNHKIDTIITKLQKQRTALVKTITKSILANSEQPSINSAFEKNCKSHNLTSREIEIVSLISKGYPYKTIASTLFISNKTVASHISNIFTKVGITNKVELINTLKATTS